MKAYRLKKSFKIFRHVLRLYRRKRKHLSKDVKEKIVQTLNYLQEELLHHDRTTSCNHAKQAQSLALIHLKKTAFERIRDFTLSLMGALCIAIIIRTMWFEFYQIPTGSMRPTITEQDRVIVSKTAFGINIPLTRGHIYFNPNLVLRNGMVIFTGSGMAINDVDTLYFYIFPGKKQYIKRLIGKPGDILYFYGGKIYGIDKYNNDISPQLQPLLLDHIEHVPYIYLQGKVVQPTRAMQGIYTPTILKQMNENIAKVEVSAQSTVVGKLLPPFNEIQDSDYFDLWGFKNYGMARLLTREEVKKYTNTPLSHLSEAPLYMEIIHHPTVRYPKIVRDHLGRLHPSIGTSSSVLSLKEEHLKTLFSNLYTARFIVKDGKVYRYGSSLKKGRYQPDLIGVPNGTYEFYYGKAYQVFISGITRELPKDHPLYQFNAARIQFFYNLGIEFATFYAPMAKEQHLLPSRYVYYRHRDLYAMGTPLMTREDPTLLDFIQKEYKKQQNAPSYRPHFPFDDNGAPVDQNGKVQVDFIKQYGIKIPPKQYLTLGDNYAMSADSRDFGFVPEENIRGVPTFIFYPFGKHFGFPLQIHYPFLNSPRSLVWCLALIALSLWYIYHRALYKLPIKIE